MARRPRATPDAPRTLVAAATRIPLANPKAAKAAAKKAQEWQAEAWAFYDAVPEIKFAVNWKRNLVGKVRLFVAVKSPESGEPMPVDAEGSPISPGLAADAIAELARLVPMSGGQASIQTEFSANMDVAGECYLVGQAERIGGGPEGTDLPERWDIKSVDEIDVDGQGRYRLKNEQGKVVDVLDPEQDTAIRLWRQHPRFGSLPESNVRAVLTDCKVLQTLTETLLAEANSRRNAGILIISNEVVGLRREVQSPTSEDARNIPLMADLADSLTAPIADPSSGASVIPLLWSVPSEQVEKAAKHLTLGRQTDASTDLRIEKRVERVARGMDVPVEVVLGHQSTTFSNAEQIDEDSFTDHVEPMCLLMVDSFSSGFLRPNLLETHPSEGDAIGTIFVWFDPTDVIGSPDQKESANDAHDRLTISDAKYRAVFGYSDDDAPGEDEMARRLAMKGQIDAALTAALLLLAGVNVPEPAGAPPGGVPAGDGTAAAALMALLAGAVDRGPPLRAVAGGARPRSPQG